MDLRIDTEFESKIPPLTEDEYRQLEENILTDGVVINPLIVWDGVIVDGHNRFHIAEQHPHIEYSVHEKQFSDRHAAVAWICKNQLGRRNLTVEQKKYLIGKQYEAEKASHGGDRGVTHDENGKFASSSQIDNLRSKEKTCERIARENGISSRTVLRAESFSKAVDIAEDVSPGIRREILSGSIRPTEKEITAFVRAGPEERAALAEELRQPRDNSRKPAERKKHSEQQEALLQARKIGEDMLHAKSAGTESDMLYELRDALESFVFRWTFCLNNFAHFFKRKSCQEEIRKLIREGFEFMTQIEGGNIPQ